MNQNYSHEIEQLQKQTRRLGNWVLILAVLCMVSITSPLWRPAPVQAANDQVLRVRELIVVDANGTERVRIAAPLPESLVLGKRIVRGSAISGILMFDAEGNERSGYGTDDNTGNMLFTLDSPGAQHVLFSASRQGVPILRMWGHNSKQDFLRLGVSSEDGPQIQLIHGGKTIFEQPPAENVQPTPGAPKGK